MLPRPDPAGAPPAGPVRDPASAAPAGDPHLLDPYTAGDAELSAALGDPPTYRLSQLRAWLARGIDDPQAMTDLPRALRDRLAEVLEPPPRVLAEVEADAGLTRKVLLALSGSGERIEAVLMAYPADATRERGRATVCISTQAGCAMGCPFCATGQAGLRGQLSVGEIVRQVTVIERLLAQGRMTVEGVPDHVTNVVFMGMGEPLANLEGTLGAVRWLTGTFGLSARALTVSTIGLVPGMAALTALGLPVRLAVSLHAPTNTLRNDLVPANRSHPIEAVLEAADAHAEATGRRVTYEYVLIDGVNTAPEQAEQLAALLSGRRLAHVNLIPLNATPGVAWTAPPVAVQRAFCRHLTDAGLPATIRANRGGTIDAACGQLYASYQMGSGRRLPAAVGAADRIDGLVGR